MDAEGREGEEREGGESPEGDDVDVCTREMFAERRQTDRLTSDVFG